MAKDERKYLLYIRNACPESRRMCATAPPRLMLRTWFRTRSSAICR